MPSSIILQQIFLLSNYAISAINTSLAGSRTMITLAPK
nr:MAG TPA: hypothetical protein [Caudoviricetes sp.]